MCTIHQRPYPRRTACRIPPPPAPRAKPPNCCCTPPCTAAARRSPISTRPTCGSRTRGRPTAYRVRPGAARPSGRAWRAPRSCCRSFDATRDVVPCTRPPTRRSSCSNTEVDGTVRASGATFTLGFVSVLRVVDGLIVSARDYSNPLETAEIAKLLIKLRGLRAHRAGLTDEPFLVHRAERQPDPGDGLDLADQAVAESPSAARAATRAAPPAIARHRADITTHSGPGPNAHDQPGAQDRCRPRWRSPSSCRKPPGSARCRLRVRAWRPRRMRGPSAADCRDSSRRSASSSAGSVCATAYPAEEASASRTCIRRRTRWYSVPDRRASGPQDGLAAASRSAASRRPRSRPASSRRVDALGASESGSSETSMSM